VKPRKLATAGVGDLRRDADLDVVGVEPVHVVAAELVADHLVAAIDVLGELRQNAVADRWPTEVQKAA
jgi:hypothetical protein